MTVRTRIAPSPTGDPHVGTAYVALFNLCYARKHGGQFLLRIEDTDRARSTAASEQAILDSMRWIGLEWDEGPDVGGPSGPYRQSERGDIYAEHVRILLVAGQAFRCFCSAERLDALRKQQAESKQDHLGYDGHCRQLSSTEVESKVAAGEPHVVRMIVPDTGTCEIQDLLRGAISIDYAQVDMQVLLKSDGMPTYHLANVVDDHLMGITHVIRGEEWLASAPKHLLLYAAFGWQPPALCHLPLLRNPDKSKLSKRKNPTSIGFYRRLGLLPEALLNYLGLMGWSMPSGEEKFSLPEMIEQFDLDRISLGGPVFDVEKLSWLNGRYLREDLDVEQLADRLEEWALNRSYLLPILPLIQQRVDRLSDVLPKIQHFYIGLPELSEHSFEHKTLQQDDCRRILQFASWRLEAVVEWAIEPIREALTSLAEPLELKVRDLLFPLFVAISGQAVSTPLYETLAHLGPDLSKARVRHAIDVLGGLGKKQLKKLEQQYRALA